jgi:hypothetical protein
VYFFAPRSEALLRWFGSLRVAKLLIQAGKFSGGGEWGPQGRAGEAGTGGRGQSVVVGPADTVFLSPFGLGCQLGLEL